MLSLKEFFKSQKFLLGLIFAGFFLIGFAGTYLTLTLTQKPKVQVQTQISESELTPGPFEPITIEESYNVVLLGSGGEGHSGGTLTDSIIMVSINSKDNKATLISIPRDLWIPGGRKINTEVSTNGLDSIKSTLQGITGLEISKYLSVDFSGLIKIIDNLGGIEVDIPKTFDDYFYPIKGLENETCGLSNEKIAGAHQKYSGFELEKQFTCRWEHIHFDKGITQINGENALKLARSRHGDSDFGRSARQFAILKGIVKKISISNIDETYKSFSKIVKTDFDLKTVKELTKLFGDPSSYETSETHLTENNVLSASKSSNGQYILIPKAGTNNFSEVKSFISK